MRMIGGGMVSVLTRFLRRGVQTHPALWFYPRNKYLWTLHPDSEVESRFASTWSQACGLVMMHPVKCCKLWCQPGAFVHCIKIFPLSTNILLRQVHTLQRAMVLYRSLLIKESKESHLWVHKKWMIARKAITGEGLKQPSMFLLKINEAFILVCHTTNVNCYHSEINYSPFKIFLWQTFKTYLHNKMCSKTKPHTFGQKLHHRDVEYCEEKCKINNRILNCQRGGFNQPQFIIISDHFTFLRTILKSRQRIPEF